MGRIGRGRTGVRGVAKAEQLKCLTAGCKEWKGKGMQLVRRLGSIGKGKERQSHKGSQARQ
jgi:hypothetical protein